MKLKQIAAILTAALILAQSTMVFAEDVSSLSTGSEVSTQATSSVESNVSESVSESVISSESSSPSTEQASSSVKQAASSEPEVISSSSEGSSSSEASSISEISSSSDTSSSSSSESVSSSEVTDEEAEINAQAADGITSFVERMYKIALGRDSDIAGVADWTSRLRSGTAKGIDIMSGFFNSPEYKDLNKSDADFVRDLYLAAFGREPEAAGLADWTTRLSYYVSRSYVIEGIAGSAEFINLCATYGIESGHLNLTENRDKNINVTSFVTRLYKIALGHEPAIDGLNDWTGRIISGATNGAQAVHGFFLSNEYKSKNKSDSAYVSDLYNVMLNRTADSSSSTWTTALDNGVSREYVINGVSGSQEFMNLCKQYGINSGTLVLAQSRDKNAKVTAFVQSFYKGLLKRNGDEGGLNDWTGKLLGGTASGTNVALGFIGSSEMTGKTLTNAEYVSLMYNVSLGRTPSAAEVANWTQYLDYGCTRDYIVYGFLNSNEFKTKCTDAGVSHTAYAVTNNCDKNPNVTAIVQRLYTNALGRTASTSELNTRTGSLISKQSTVGALINEIFSSSEYTNRNLTNIDFIHVAYKAILGRDANDVEVATQLNYLTTHAAKDLLSVLVSSSEFATICNTAGIISGSLTGSKAVYNIIDVSKYQFTIDWSKVATEDIDGVYVRAVSTSNEDGLYVDPYFAANVIGAKRAGLKVGAYYFMYGATVAECSAEVNLMLNEIAKLEAQGYYLDLPVMCDLENNPSKLSAGDLTMLGRYSMNLIELAGYYPLLYTGVDFSKKNLNLSEIGNRDLWIAWYPYLLYNGAIYGKGTPYENVSAPIGATPCTKSGGSTNPSAVGINSYSMWQYRSDARISGINANVDLNYAYKDYATILATTTRSDGTKWNHLK